MNVVEQIRKLPNLHGPQNGSKFFSFERQAGYTKVTLYQIIGDEIIEGPSVKAITNKPGTYKKSG